MNQKFFRLPYFRIAKDGKYSMVKLLKIAKILRLMPINGY